jgi:hypothetical protein
MTPDTLFIGNIQQTFADGLRNLLCSPSGIACATEIEDHAAFYRIR